jgi:hypothetical protein
MLPVLAGGGVRGAKLRDESLDPTVEGEAKVGVVR